MTGSQSTRDVLERLLARMTGIEEELRQFRTEVTGELGALRIELCQDHSVVQVESQQGLGAIRGEIRQLDARLHTATRWLVGLMLLSWLSMMASIWLKP